MKSLFTVAVSFAYVAWKILSFYRFLAFWTLSVVILGNTFLQKVLFQGIDFKDLKHALSSAI